jgi:hypothetical protein
VKVDGDGELTAITPEGTHDAFVSPDSMKLIVRKERSFVVLSADGSREIQRLETQSNNERIVGWARDSKSVYTFGWRDVPSHLSRVDLETGKRQLITKLQPTQSAGVMTVQSASISPDEKWYVYEARMMTSRFFQVEGAK